jgi:hypothetical protein
MLPKHASRYFLEKFFTVIKSLGGVNEIQQKESKHDWIGE